MASSLGEITTDGGLGRNAPPFASWFPNSTFDATYGSGLRGLLEVRTTVEPDHFTAFWASCFAQASAVDPRPRRQWVARQDGFDVFDVEFSTLGGYRLGGWLVLPDEGVIDRGIVVSHGYGGRSAPDIPLPLDGAAAFFPCSRGLPDRGLVPGIPHEIDQHVLHGIEDPATYVLAGCAADVWCAASALQVMVGGLSRLDYVGVSFGGGIGALAVPWDHRFSSAVLMLPSFGQHELRRELPCDGSGEAVRRYAAEHPEVRRVLPYFDAALGARHISIPTLVGAALWDPMVPPPCQFAVYNELRGPRELFVFSAGHVSYPAEQDEDLAWRAAVAEFLRR